MPLRALEPNIFLIKEDLVCVSAPFNRHADKLGCECVCVCVSVCVCVFCTKVCPGTLGAKDRIHSRSFLADAHPIVATPCAFVTLFFFFLFYSFIIIHESTSQHKTFGILSPFVCVRACTCHTLCLWLHCPCMVLFSVTFRLHRYLLSLSVTAYSRYTDTYIYVRVCVKICMTPSLWKGFNNIKRQWWTFWNSQ